MSIVIRIEKYTISRSRADYIKDMYAYSFTYSGTAVNLEDYLVDDTMELTDAVELNEPYEFSSGRAEFSIKKFAALNSLFNATDLANVDVQFFITIKLNGDYHFLGYVEKQDLLEDVTNENYIISATSLLTYFMSLEDWVLPTLTTNTIDNALQRIFSSFGWTVNYQIDLIHSSQKTINETNYNSCRSNGMSVPQFIKEVCKALVCHIDISFYTGIVEILLISRNNQLTYFPSYSIDAMILDNTEEYEIYKPPKYNRVAVNAEWFIEYSYDEEFVLSGGALPPVSGTTREEGIAIISPSSTTSGSPAVFFKADLEGYESDSSLLNLVEKTEYSNNQWQYDTGATTVFFRFSDDSGNVPIGNAVNFAKDIIYPQEYRTMELNGTNIFKFQKLTYNSQDYRVIEFNKNTTSETTKVRLQRIIN